MRLEMKVKRARLKEMARSYQGSRKKIKSQILDEFVGMTGYNLGYASFLLRWFGRKLSLNRGDGSIVVIVGEARKIKRARERIYDEEFKRVLIWLWKLLDYSCSKKLVAALKWLIPKLEEQKGLKVKKVVREKLLRVSAATVDRLLKKERKRYELKPRARTKPGPLLKHEVAIRTFSEWDETRPGFLEIDLVSRDGGKALGDFCYSLNACDAASGWREAVRNRAQVWAFQAREKIKERLPFKLLGIDSDNDGAFIIAHLINYCQENKLTFTRSRPYQKNDNCFVEQKNYSLVRRLVGYSRYNTEEELKILNELYSVSRLYYNFFQVVMKLQTKERQGNRVRKKYDEPRTPYQRILQSPYATKEEKERLMRLYSGLS